MKNENVKDYLSIFAGTFLIAISVSVFFDSANLVTGGVTGLSLIIADTGRRFFDTEIPLWLSNLALNIPLFIIAYKVKGKGFLARTVFATLFLSVALSITQYLPKYTDTDFVIPAVFGGVISGTGMGLVLRSRATTGGTDIAATTIHHYFRHLSIAKILFVIDTSILVLGFLAFGIRSTMYAIIAVFITSKMTNNILEGLNFSKAVFIISDFSSEIAKKIMETTDRGATAFDAKGVYTGNRKDVLLIVMSTKELIVTKDVVKKVDADAFVIVTDVREVLGEGFKIIQ